MRLSRIVVELKTVPNAYRPVSFWFLNHELRADELRRQIGEMADKGFGGFMLHGRDGLRTPYLSPEWESAIGIAIAEAKTRGLHAWLYDENNYPSGIAGGKLVEKYPDRTMLTLVPTLDREVRAGQALAVNLPQKPAFVLATPVTGPARRPINLLRFVNDGRLEWRNPTGRACRVLVLDVVPWQPNPGNHPDFVRYPDYLDAALMREFIDMTHGWYTERFGRECGKTVQGIFTDNGCAHFGHIRRGIPWSRQLAQRYFEVTGQSIADVLPGLLLPTPGHEEDRLRFWRFFGDEFIRTFVGAINRHCNRHRLFSTGHYCLEDGLGEHVRQIGDYFDVMKNQNFNAVDQLGPAYGGDLWDKPCGEHLPSCIVNTASAALWHDSPRVMCESFGLASDGHGLDLGEMRRITGFLAALGVDLFVPHGIYYSIAGSRKWECTPDHFHNPFWPFYREWSDYAGRLSELMAGWQSVAQVAVLYPVTTLQAHVELGVKRPQGSDLGAVSDEVEACYHTTITGLCRNQVGFDILPEDMLQKGQVSDGRLQVPTRRGKGQCAFSALVLPAMRVIEKASLENLRRFAAAGGAVLCLNTVPTEIYDPVTRCLSPIKGRFLGGRYRLLREGTDAATCVALVEKLRAVAPQPVRFGGDTSQLAVRVWEKWGKRFVLIHNASLERQLGITITVAAPREPVRLDLDTAELGRLPWTHGDGEWTLRRDFESAESLLLTIPEADDVLRLPPPEAPRVWRRRVALPPEWDVEAETENLLPLLQGITSFEKEFQRDAFEFEVGERFGETRLLLDLEMARPELLADRHRAATQLFLNGKLAPALVPGRRLDRWIFETDVTALLRKGVNRVEIRHGGIYLDHNRRLYTPYVCGRFAVARRGNRDVLVRPSKGVVLGDWRKQGWPSYAGTLIYRQTIVLPPAARNCPLMLELGKVANLAEVRVDGKTVGCRVLPPWRVELPSVEGRKAIHLEVRVANTAATLFVPPGSPSGWFGPARLRY